MNPQKWTTPQQTRRIAVEQYQKYDAALKRLEELQALDSARSPSALVAGTLPSDRPASTSLSRPALTGHEVRSRHAALAGTFAVCPPEWDLSPREYGEQAVTSTAAYVTPARMIWTFALLLAMTMLLGIERFDLIDDTTGLRWALGGLGAIVGVVAVADTRGRLARHRLRGLDPRDVVVLTRPESQKTIEAFTRPLAAPDADGGHDGMPVGMSLAQRERILTTAYETALRLRAEEENATVEATSVPSATSSATSLTARANPSAAETDPLERRRRWTLLLARFEHVDKQWADLLTDPLAVLEHARLLDVSHPPTAAFIEAHGHARDLIGSRTRTSPDTDLPPVETLREIETAVRTMATAWTDAQTRAQRAGYAWLPDADRKRARQATSLLTQAADTQLSVQAAINLTEKALELLRAIETVPIPQPVLRALGQATAPVLGPALGPVLGPARTAGQS